MAGRLIGVVGPSGVGKDSVMAGLAAARPDCHIQRRVITRAAEAGCEAFDAVSETVFQDMVARDAFCLHWAAHGLRYGIPAAMAGRLAQGQDVLVNLSRSVLGDAAARFAGFTVLSLSARPETLAARLAGRGRETAEDIGKRLERAAPVLPRGLCVIEIANDGALDETIGAAMKALFSMANTR